MNDPTPRDAARYFFKDKIIELTMSGKQNLRYVMVDERGKRIEKIFPIDDVLTEMHKIVIGI